MAEVKKNRILVGLTGPLGSGVSSVSSALDENSGFQRISLSAGIKAELKSRTPDFPELASLKMIVDWRQKLQDIGNEFRQNNAGYWVEKIIPAISAEKDVVIDGIRNPAEAILLREQFTHFFLIAVIASPETRWNRIQSDYAGSRPAFDEVDKRDAEEDIDWGQQVTRCIQLADYTLINDTDLGSSSVRSRRLSELLTKDLSLMRAVDQSEKPQATFVRRTPMK